MSDASPVNFVQISGSFPASVPANVMHTSLCLCLGHGGQVGANRSYACPARLRTLFPVVLAGKKGVQQAWLFPYFPPFYLLILGAPNSLIPAGAMKVVQRVELDHSFSFFLIQPSSSTPWPPLVSAGGA
eukprot:scaffold111982_cov16-Tisochrysis_lutea.AAC.1